ncbi:transglycosylase domain-containing protein [Streptomyces sp. CoH27]|uniref:transglycosylase domain-containing protein n=1 Tax=Streptomyces sp. CoH27 TaxID=2875763 RepID=UPI001CD25D83|nr:transglycosylase domain-containing protein [Streptomyces sp. CoH27]
MRGRTPGRTSGARRRLGRLVRARRTRGRRLRRVLAAFAVLLLLLVGTIVVAYERTKIPKPHPETAMQSTVFVDEHGRYLGVRGPVDRQDVPLSRVPRHVQDAVIAAENRTFRSDHGISPRAVLRAAVSTLSGGEREGGSTITQQYVKNALLSPEQSLSRKFREALIAVKLDRNRSKDEILQGYLNTVYFGRGAAGIQSAARNYFGVDVQNLTISQGAVLASIINIPSYYEHAGSDPKVTQTLVRRWQWVLDAMADSGAITTKQRAQARFPAFRFYPPGDADGQRQYLIDTAAQEAADRLGISQDELARGGYTVRTTFDLQTQDAVTDKVSLGMVDVPKGTTLHAAVIALVPGDGAVRVLYGGPDYAHQPFNDALSGAVEAGTALDPFKSVKLKGPLATLPQSTTPNPLRLASAYATMTARGKYAAPYTVAQIIRAGRTVYTAHAATQQMQIMTSSAEPGTYHFSGGAGTGPGARTLWTTDSTTSLSTTVALFAEHPAQGKRKATTAHLPTSAGNLSNSLSDQVLGSGGDPRPVPRA